MSSRRVDSLIAHAPVALMLLTLPLVFWLYVPGVSGPLMFDDYSSLVPVSLQADSEVSFREFVFGDRAGPLGRPLSMLTFAVEQRVFGITLAEAKVTNVLLHAVNGLVLFCFLRLVFLHQVPARGAWFAFLAAAFWLFAPVHVSTVLYLVQRMAILAAFFVLLAMLLYVWGRHLKLRGASGWWLPCALSPVFVAAGMFAKENAVMGFPCLLLLEILVFRLQGFSSTFAARVRIFLAITSVIGGVLACILLWLNWPVLEKSFQLRPFSLSERLLTQLRVLWDYVAQTLLPDVSRMGIHHDDFPVSSSLFQPLSTLYAALGWLLTLSMAGVLLYHRLGRLVALGVMFFLVTHVLESSIIPLEIYYEHRNYLPAVGLFLSVAGLLVWLAHRVEGLSTAIGISAVIYLGFLVFSTSSQVRVWSVPSLLAINAVQAHPQSPRANVDLAVHLARNGAYPLALEYSESAHSLSRDERWLDYRLRNVILACYADAPVPAISLFDIPPRERQRPAADVHTLSVLVQLVNSARCGSVDVTAVADELAAVFIDGSEAVSASALYYSRLAALENALARYETAHWYAQRYLDQAPDSVTAMLMLLHFSAVLGRNDQEQVLRDRLWELRARGKLSASEVDTLTLYGPAGNPDK